MATVMFPTQLAVGMRMVFHAAMEVRRDVPRDRIEVTSTRFAVEDYAVVGTTPVSAVDAPASLQLSCGVGRLAAQASVDVDPKTSRFDCDARFLAADAAAGLDGDLAWRPRHGSDQFVLVAPPGAAPTVLAAGEYEFYHAIAHGWVNNEAVAFTGNDFLASPSPVWAVNPAKSGGFGMVGVWCLSDVISRADLPVQGFVNGGRTLTVHLDANDKMVARYDGRVIGGMTFNADWYYRPVAVELSYWPGQRAVHLTVNASGWPAVTRKLPALDPDALFGGQVALMWGSTDSSCELLDFAVWRDHITTDKVAAAMATYSALYGV